MLGREKMYSSKVKIGNWNDDALREEDAKREYLERKKRGELTTQKVDLLKQNILTPMNLSLTNDGRLHFGDIIMPVNMGGEKRECIALSINVDINSIVKSPSPSIQAPCGISAGSSIQPCVRNAFIITSVDGSPEGSTLLYGQSFALKTTSGFASGLYMTSDIQSFQKCASKSRLQEVKLDDDVSFLSWWKIEHFDPQERLEHDGQPVLANVKVLIKHCKTNQALAVLRDQYLWTTYGKEYEVTAHTFLDAHKAEQDKNHWILCTSNSVSSLIPLNHPESVGNNNKPTQTTDHRPE